MAWRRAGNVMRKESLISITEKIFMINLFTVAGLSVLSAILIKLVVCRGHFCVAETGRV